MAGDSGAFGKTVGIATILAAVIGFAAWQWPKAPSNDNQAGDKGSTTSVTSGRSVTPMQPPPTTEDVAGQIKREGTTTFGDLVEIDFDSSSPDWGISDRGSGHDVRTLGGEMLVYGPGALGYFGNHPPTYEECQAFTNYSQPDKSLWKPGKSFCLRTSEGRYASITVEPEDDAPEWSVTASVSVWKSQADAP